ncbi:MAG: MopE-related protein [bacterium]
MQDRFTLAVIAVAAALALALTVACGPIATFDGSGDGGSDGNDNENAGAPVVCTGGIDEDGDGYGDGCPAGNDCDDSDPTVNPGAPELCNLRDDNCNGFIDDGAYNPCGNCSPGCSTDGLGTGVFPMPDPNNPDPDIEADGVGLNPNGDLVLDETNVSFAYMWIANTDDLSVGTVSKIDTQTCEEVARYYSTTCYGGNPGWQPGGSCLDVGGGAVQQSGNNPSRTAVDFNFDVWVANRAFGGQPSVTKIANDESDCIDRNGDGVITTSWDANGDGQINVNDPNEFPGLADECVLFTTNYASANELGRSVCLDAGDAYSGGYGNAWVGTYNRSSNRFYKINGSTGDIDATVDLPSGVSPYGCAVDSTGILWAAGGWHGAGRLAYFDTANPSAVGPVLSEPFTSNNHFYGIAVDSDDSVWIAGWDTRDVFRYRPERANGFGGLGGGGWTRIRTSENGYNTNTRGIAADLRGWIWVAGNDGYVMRVPQTMLDGDHSWNAAAGLGATVFNRNLGGAMVGVGIDFDGHVWGVSQNASQAVRLDLDANGDPVDLNNATCTVPVGTHPYTYSDFTGYGLRNFTRPRGTYSVLMEGCPDPNRNTNWIRVEWNATTPSGTAVKLRVRSGDAPTQLGDWFGSWESSPAELGAGPVGPVLPMPARYLEVEFELSTTQQENTPILHDFTVVWDCEAAGVN